MSFQALTYGEGNRVLTFLPVNDNRIRELMNLAIEQARLCTPESKAPHPKVGAVLADRDGEVLLTAYRGEQHAGQHAEFTLFSKAEERGLDVSGASLFVTLEPCTERGPGKTPCANRILKSGISHIYVGMLDPNPDICGHGVTLLQQGNLFVDHFPSELVRQLHGLNRHFVELHRVTRLPKTSLYVTKRISEFLTERLQREGVQIDGIPADWDLTIDDLVRYCEGATSEALRPRLPALISAARGDAFDRKYVNYTYAQDARGTDRAWQQDLRSILFKLGADDYTARHVINVGIGNGEEAAGWLEELRHLTIVDAAPQSLAKAQRALPYAQSLQLDAEDLNAIKTGSQQLYVSLRTFQSSFFDIPQALREAHRVLTRGGCIIVSISNAFVGEDGALIPGHVIPGSALVDRERPWSLVKLIRRKLDVLQFEQISVRSERSEIYVSARKAT